MSTIFEIIKEVLNDIFAEFDRSSAIKNIIDSLNLGESANQQICLYQQNLLQKIQRNIYRSGKSKFSVFSMRIVSGIPKRFRLPITHGPP